MAEVPNLSAMKRDELEAYAATVGIADPASFGSVADLRAAIQAAPAVGKGAVVPRTNAGVNSPGQDSGVVQTNLAPNEGTVDAQEGQKVGVYIVDGQKVDPNGKPVKG